MYIPHGTAPEHFNPKIANAEPAGAGELHGFRSRSDERQHPGAAAALQAVRQRLPGLPVPGRGRDPRPASSTACRVRRRSIRTTARTTVEHVIAQGAQRQAADPGRLLAHHQRAGQERDVVLERHADRSGEEPGQGVRQPVRRRHHRAARERGRAASQGSAGVHRVRGAGPADDAAGPDLRTDQAGDAPGGDPVAAGGREHDDAGVGLLDEAEPARAWRWCARAAPATCPAGRRQRLLLRGERTSSCCSRRSWS